jgi:hypothetical protein
MFAFVNVSGNRVWTPILMMETKKSALPRISPSNSIHVWKRTSITAGRYRCGDQSPEVTWSMLGL